MEQVILSALDSIPWALLLKLAVGAIILAIAKRYYDNISAYAMFRSNKDLGKNVRVIINGKGGFITSATWRFIYVRLKESGNEMIIPITKWTDQKWEIFKNGNK